MIAKTARKSPTPAAPPSPTLISLSEIAEIRWRGHGKDDHTVTLTAERLAGVLRIAEMLWHVGGAWQYLGDNGVALNAGNLKELLGDLIGNGEAVSVSALSVLEGVAASMEAHAIYGAGGRADDFTLVMREKGSAA